MSPAAGPPPSPRRRAARATAVTAALAIALATGGCAKSDGDDARGKTEIGSAATAQRRTTSPAPTTTAATGTTAPLATTGSGTPLQAAQQLYDAWKAGDRAAAGAVARPEAVDGVFATAPGDYAEYNSCDSAEFDTSGCLFRGNNGTIQFTMERQGDAWVVTDALYAPP